MMPTVHAHETKLKRATRGTTGKTGERRELRYEWIHTYARAQWRRDDTACYVLRYPVGLWKEVD